MEMNRRILTVLILVVISTVLTFYTLFLIFFRYLPVTFDGSSNPVSTYNGPVDTLVGIHSATIPMTFAVVGWLLAGYELFAERKKEISQILRTKVSGKRDHWNLYNVFKGKGGARRLTILEALSTPRQRNEVAKLTNTDWKEVERNIRILESANLVRTGPSKTTFPYYELTEQGEDLLKKIAPVIES